MTEPRGTERMAGPRAAGPGLIKSASGRTRDPARKERILAAAADLVASRGYHAVSMADIGAAAGITGSAIYRHFPGKPALLTALFDRVIDGLLSDEREIVRQALDHRRALLQLVQGQVEFVVADRELAQVYHNEIHSLPAGDRRRLRRKQRLYLEEWVHLVGELHPGLTDSDARAIVHAAIGAIQSVLLYAGGLPDDRLRELLAGAAGAVLGCGEPGPAGSGHGCRPVPAQWRRAPGSAPRAGRPGRSG